MTSVNEAAKRIKGLSEKEVLQARDLYGDNYLAERQRKGFVKEFVRNFGDPIIKILLIALAVNIVIQLRDFDWYESLGIAVAILISTFVSTLSEYGSESAFEKLQEDALKIKCRVKRSGAVIELVLGELVVGDHVLLQAGERIPADGAIVSGELTVDQSPLNGESKEAYKSPNGKSSSDEGFSDWTRLFRGSIVLSGEAVMLIKNVGSTTFYGKLAEEIQEAPRESPLKARLRHLAGSISKLGYCGAGLVLFANLFFTIVVMNGFYWPAILGTLRNPQILSSRLIAAVTLAISVVVVAIPEGLPLMITVVLSSNMKRMLRDNVLVRRLVGIETSGSLNILFTDKTGTLTKGKLTVSRFITGDGASFESFTKLGKTQTGRLLAITALHNTGAFVGKSDGKAAALGGNSTERALLEFIALGRGVTDKLRPVVTIPFSSSLKFSAVQLAGDFGITLIKGAPELILPNCTHYYDKHGIIVEFAGVKKLKSEMETLQKNAYRLLAIAAGDSPLGKSSPGGNLTLIGIAAIRDEVRREAASAIADVKGAGIQVVMITGDNRDTAVSVAREVGLLRGEGADADSVITSAEMKKLSDTELKKILPSLRVVARAIPSDKSRLVAISQDIGLVTGMTGDGINDSPALKKADIGFSMGSGAEVAKEAGDIVILDDNFMSISKAILYGRTIFKSIRKFIIFQLTINFCAVGISVIGPFIGINSPITVLQMLWVNMVMDTLAGLAFAGEPPLREYMKEPPKKRDEPILSPYMYNQILVTGTYVTLLCILFLKLPRIRGVYLPPHFMTAFFALFIFAGIFNSFNARTTRINLLTSIWKNKAFMVIMLFVTAVQIVIIYFGGTVFRTTGLTVRELQFSILLAFTVIPVDMIRKALIDKRRRGNAL